MTRGYYRLPPRERRWKGKRLGGYIEVWPDRANPYEVHSWDGEVSSSHKTWDDAIEALEAM